MTREKANEALTISKKANQIAISANALSENANSLFKESLKLSNRQYQILVEPNISIRLLSEETSEDGHTQSNWEIKNIGKGSALDLNIDFISYQVYGKQARYVYEELAPNVRPQLVLSTDPKYSQKEKGEHTTFNIELPDSMEEHVRNMCWIWLIITFKNEDKSQKFIQFIRLHRFHKEDWIIEIDNPSIHKNVG
ncbi:MAG TPA: hypothetical protein PLJ13_09080 [Cyclobacteriaceae bacterium]|nr:hypothetical protein [Cyclobacteriaceae bacterium]